MRYLLLTILLALTLQVSAKLSASHCDKDIVKVDSIITELQKLQDVSTGDRMVFAAEALRGAGYDDYYLTDSVATLRINVDSFTPLMFINNVIALAKASEHPGFVDANTFEAAFEDISCRKGIFTGYPSIMFHSSDWIGDNVARGNVTELTENFSGVVARTKSLDEMTRKRNDFAALADSSVFESVRMVEMGFRTHRIPSLKKETIKKREVIDELRNGDIIILVPSRDGIDIYDAGIIAFEGEEPYLIHLSPQSHKIVRESDSLARYLSLVTKYFQGYRIIRLKE